MKINMRNAAHYFTIKMGRVLATLATITLLGCVVEAESAQERSIVPNDMRIAGERADKGRIKGSDDAPIRIVEISDFQ